MIPHQEIGEIKIAKPEKSEITFGVKNGWVMKLSEEGIKFNTEKYPPDKISEEVIRILCESFWPKIKEYYEKSIRDY